MTQVSYAVGKDTRIGPKFLNASVRFSGSSFQKDIPNLVYICGCNGLPEVAEYMKKFDWDHPVRLQSMSSSIMKQVTVVCDAYEATKGAHCLCIVTEWGEFKILDFQKIYDNMQKPAFVFDGRNVVNMQTLLEIGFIVCSISKSLDAWLRDMSAVA